MFGRREQIIIFGCGSSGERAFRELSHKVKLVGFADNNSQLHGETFQALPVFSPDELRNLEWDRICIASMYFEEIRQQLEREYGWGPSKVFVSREHSIPSGQSRLPAVLRTWKIPGTRQDFPLWRLRNRHKGERGFIVGNGPSLQMEDLDMLARNSELSLASNKIFLAFKLTGWRPTYYGIQDPDTPKQAPREIEAMECPIFAADYVCNKLTSKSNLVPFRLRRPVTPPALPEFSFNALNGLVSGRTITFTLLQIAAWLGFERVFLLGVDFNYDVGPTFAHSQYRGLEGYAFQPATQNNYFVKDYHKPGETILKPYMDYQLCAYEAARKQCHDAGRMKIFNATRGGKLETFKRVGFDSLF